MASIEAMECLHAGGASWEEYVASSSGQMIDLTFADLAGADLRNRRFRNCDLTGAQMQAANLDGCTLTNCLLSAVDMANTSLVRCGMNQVNAQAIDLDGAVIREARFSGVDLTGASLANTVMSGIRIRGGVLHDTQLDRAQIHEVECDRVTLRQLSGSQATLAECHFRDCKVDDWTLTASTLDRCAFVNSTIMGWRLPGGALMSCRIRHSQVEGLVLDDCTVQSLDLSGSVVNGVEVKTIGPGTVILLDTAMVNCVWPRQSGRTSWIGKYRPSAALLAHPIQDVKGVPPIVRREIADAQYLTRKIATTNGFVGRLLLRIWGATSAYGQSVSRLTWWSFLAVLVHTVGLLASRHELAGAGLGIGRFFRGVGFVALTFLGLGDSEFKGANWMERAIVLSIRIIGFLSLGMWVSIAANKLSRLSSE